MNWRRRRHNSPPGTGGVARSDGVVDGSNDSQSHSFIEIEENHFDLTTTPAFGHPSCSRRGVPSLLQFLHSFCDRARSIIHDKSDRKIVRDPISFRDLAYSYFQERKNRS